MSVRDQLIVTEQTINDELQQKLKTLIKEQKATSRELLQAKSRIEQLI